jgi:parvulin-like peptidyl-prolyl isomerase
VVQVKSDAGQPADEAELARATEVARAIRGAVAAAASAARGDEAPASGDDPAAVAFRRAAGEVDARGFEVRIERLDPVAADGRVLRPGGGSLVREFADVASSLRERGDVAGPFRTPFGVHVAMLLERTPPHEVSADERRALLADEILDDRIRARRDALLASAGGRVELAPNAAALLDLVRVQ